MMENSASIGIYFKLKGEQISSPIDWFISDKKIEISNLKGVQVLMKMLSVESKIKRRIELDGIN